MYYKAITYFYNLCKHDKMRYQNHYYTIRTQIVKCRN
jgi:hypothetical protein